MGLENIEFVYVINRNIGKGTARKASFKLPVLRDITPPQVDTGLLNRIATFFSAFFFIKRSLHEISSNQF